MMRAVRVCVFPEPGGLCIRSGLSIEALAAYSCSVERGRSIAAVAIPSKAEADGEIVVLQFRPYYF
jgi:hypothetical protein